MLEVIVPLHGHPGMGWPVLEALPSLIAWKVNLW